MKEVQGVICDDEPLAQDMISSSLQSCFRKYGYNLILDKYTDPLLLCDALEKKKYDLAFLDIEMPGIDGIELGKRLKSQAEYTTVIFISNYEEKVFDSFAAHPFGFVRKSSFLKDVKSVVKMYISSNRREERHIVQLKLREEIIKLAVEDIIYFECMRDYQYIYLKNAAEPVKIKYRMNLIEEKFKNYGFLRIHHGYIVNYAYIKKIKAETVELVNGESIPISRSKRKDVLLEYMRLSRSDDSVLCLYRGAEEQGEDSKEE